MPVIPGHGKLRPEDFHEYKPNLGYIVSFRSCLKETQLIN